jgi:DNA-binding NtrC family response regulator
VLILPRGPEHPSQPRQGFCNFAERHTVTSAILGTPNPELPYAAQVKLLVNVRLIAVTNRDLAKDVAARRFREDLYYRLNVVTFEIPPLREQLDDLRGLAEALLTRIACRMQQAISGFTASALERILNYAWPGNIRELENAIESACALATGALIDVDDLPAALHTRLPDGDRARDGFALADGHRPVRDCHPAPTTWALAIQFRVTTG